MKEVLDDICSAADCRKVLGDGSHDSEDGLTCYEGVRRCG